WIDADTRRLNPATTRNETNVRVQAMTVRSGCKPGSGSPIIFFTAKSPQDQRRSLSPPQPTKLALALAQASACRIAWRARPCPIDKLLQQLLLLRSQSPRMKPSM